MDRSNYRNYDQEEHEMHSSKVLPKERTELVKISSK